MKKELNVFRERYQKNIKVGQDAFDASKKNAADYIRLSKEYSDERRAIYKEMCEAGMYEEWLSLEEEFAEE